MHLRGRSPVPVHTLDAEHAGVFLALTRNPNKAEHGVARAKPKPLDLRLGDVHVVVRGDVVVPAQEAVAIREEFEDALGIGCFMLGVRERQQGLDELVAEKVRRELLRLRLLQEGRGGHRVEVVVVDLRKLALLLGVVEVGKTLPLTAAAPPSAASAAHVAPLGIAALVGLAWSKLVSHVCSCEKGFPQMGKKAR